MCTSRTQIEVKSWMIRLHFAKGGAVTGVSCERDAWTRPPSCEPYRSVCDSDLFRDDPLRRLYCTLMSGTNTV